MKKFKEKSCSCKLPCKYTKYNNQRIISNNLQTVINDRKLINRLRSSYWKIKSIEFKNDLLEMDKLFNNHKKKIDTWSINFSFFSRHMPFIYNDAFFSIKNLVDNNEHFRNIFYESNFISDIKLIERQVIFITNYIMAININDTRRQNYYQNEIDSCSNLTNCEMMCSFISEGCYNYSHQNILDKVNKFHSFTAISESLCTPNISIIKNLPNILNAIDLFFKNSTILNITIYEKYSKDLLNISNIFPCNMFDRPISFFYQETYEQLMDTGQIYRNFYACLSRLKDAFQTNSVVIENIIKNMKDEFNRDLKIDFFPLKFALQRLKRIELNCYNYYEILIYNIIKLENTLIRYLDNNPVLLCSADLFHHKRGQFETDSCYFL